jgi:hypothetical protein
MRKKPKTSGGYGTSTIRSQRRNQAIADAGGKVTTVALTAASLATIERAKAHGWTQNEAINSALSEWEPTGAKT